MSAAPAVAENMPHDANAERVLLGAVLIDNRALMSVGKLKAGDFYRQAHVTIFDAMVAMSDRGVEIDVVTLKSELMSRGALESIGGAAYLGELISNLPRVSNVGPWARLIRRGAAKRRLAAIGSRLVERALEEDAEPEELLAAADAALLKLGTGIGESSGAKSITSGAKAALASIEARAMNPYGLVGYSTGLVDLDRLLLGIRPSRLGIIGARLGHGKSILTLQIAASIAEQEPRKVVLMSSLEMDATELAERRLSSIAHVDVTRLHMAADAVRDERLGRLAKAVGKLPENLWVVEDAWSVTDLRMQARSVQAQRGLSCVIVDYLDLMDLPGKFQRTYEGIAALARTLRRMAVDLGVPVICVSQLNRSPEGKDGARRPPQMSDLAGSDEVGRAAHWAVLIDNEPPVPKGSPENQNDGIADLYLRKNRGGRPGKVRVRFDGSVALFESLSQETTPTNDRWERGQ